MKIGNRPDHGFDEPLGLLSDCHRRIEHFLVVLIAITERTSGNALPQAHRAELDGALRYFATAAPRHTADEEQSLFPRLRQCSDRRAALALQQVAELERDHREADAHHRAVDLLGRRWLADGALDVNGVRELRERLTALQMIYSAHIRVEDTEIFPTAGLVLSPGQLSEVGREMAARRERPSSI
jgi:hemerythrin-like domain-containing protein